MPTHTRIDTFTPHDIPFAVALATGFGWTTSAAWFRALVAHDPDGCFVARNGNRAIAMVTTTCYAQSAWVGNLMVSPQTGRLGLGTTLLEHALDHLERRDIRSIHLDADPPGRRIYERHGFGPRFLSRRFRLAGPSRSRSAAAMPLPLDELPAIAALDLEAFGDDRLRLLHLLRGEAESAFSTRRADRMAGYAFLTATGSSVSLGPWIAEDRAAAGELLAVADGHRADRTLRVGVPDPNRDAVALLQAWGFEETQPSLRMTRGTTEPEGMPERIFGIAYGAMG
jgi:GNAT superfamily N-acetyltransferase